MSEWPGIARFSFQGRAWSRQPEAAVPETGETNLAPIEECLADSE